MGSKRYRADGEWTGMRSTGVDLTDFELGSYEVDTWSADLVDTTNGDRFTEGAWKVVVTVKERPEGGRTVQVPRSKTFHGETAWSDARRYHDDAVMALRRLELSLYQRAGR